jgi:hypothetical protein
MTISDTLDQLVRALVVASSADALDREREGGRAPSAPDAAPAQPLASDLEAAAAEMALKRAHELDRSPPSGSDEARGRSLQGLATSVDVAETLGLGFHLGAAIERIAVAAEEGSDGALKLREAAWLIERYISLLEQRPIGADLHVSSVRLAQAGEAIADLRKLDAELKAEPGEDRAAEAEPETEPVDELSAAPSVNVTPVPGPDEPPEPVRVVNELPSIGRELFVTAGRAIIAVGAITALVLVLTLIAQWR